MMELEHVQFDTPLFLSPLYVSDTPKKTYQGKERNVR